MLTLNPLIVVVPAVVAGIALLGYASLLVQKRKAEQAKPKPVPATSKRRFETKDTLS